ncbi:MAG TPA: response regulator transcription factor [Gemmatimonadales bacterium]|jgi:two-component system OmpR family response regulator
MRILLVEDDPSVSRSVGRLLNRAGHEVDACSDAESAHILLGAVIYDVVLLDIILPGKSGLELTAELRKEGSVMPILLLSGLDSVSDVVRGLDAGADDYLTKPFQLEELMARLRAIQRRDTAERADLLQHGPFQVDRLRHVALANGEPLVLTAKEFKLLEYFMTHPGEIVLRNTLLDKIWSSRRGTQSNLVDVHVSKVRRKMARYSQDVVIETIRGVGFRLHA